jgi:class 3 adenylate cyclase
VFLGPNRNMSAPPYTAVANSSDALNIEMVETMRKANHKINAVHGTELNHRWMKFKKQVAKFVSSVYFKIFMTILTIYSLFSDDFRVVFTQSAEADKAFDACSTITFFCFLLEVTAMALTQFQVYFRWPTMTRLHKEPLGESILRRVQIGSFYFWLDVVATLTLLMEMPSVAGEMDTEGTTQQAGAAARVAARAGRIVRLMRMVKYIKFDKYFSCWAAFILSLRERFVTCADECSSALKKKNATTTATPPLTRKSRKGLSGKNSDGSGSPRKSSKKSLSIEDVSSESGKDDGGDSSLALLATNTEGEDAAGDSSRNAANVNGNTDEVDYDSDDSEIAVESLVGATMTDLTNKRVIMLVMAMLIIIPLLSADDPDQSNSVMASMIAAAGYSASKITNANLNDALALQAELNSIINNQAARYLDSNISGERVKTPIMKVEFSQPAVVFAGNSPATSVSYTEWQPAAPVTRYVRNKELSTYVVNLPGFVTTVTYDVIQDQLTESRQSIYTTIFVISLLVFGTYVFTREVDRLVIDPIEMMVALVSKISEDPLGVDYNKELGDKDGFFTGMETTILLNTINKIGGLMRVGFGEAGASIIAENLKNSSGGRLNLMTGGRMINSIFGFCDVRQFTDTTECLQEEVMLFVNRIAHILHAIVCQCSGSANKNIGDAFLLTWKLEDDMSSDQMSSLADQALLTFCKALIELSAYQDFICNFTVAANERLYKRFPGYLVRIGSGLHMGWAIEGAIGSNRKIDASYLSPHVNFTEFLESSTKSYGVPLLISEPFFKLLSPAAAKYVRNVDRIRKPGEDAIGLYTYDSDLALNWADIRSKAASSQEKSLRSKNKAEQVQAQADGGIPPLATGGLKRQRYSVHDNKTVEEGKGKSAGGISSGTGNVEEAQGTAEQEKDFAPDIRVPKYKQNVWERDADLIRLRHMAYTNPEFRRTWDTGIAAYIAGDWPTAEHIFNDTLKLSGGKCGPSKFLIKFMRGEEYGGIAPSDWPGYRQE